MKMKAIGILTALIVSASLIAGCGGGKEKSAEAAATPTPAPTATPTPAATPTPTATPTPAPTATPTPEPTETPEPTPVPGATPKVVDNPTDENVFEGGSCIYIATAENAESLVWHFVSPDGQTDVPYTEIGQYFDTLYVTGGTEEYLQLFDIPLDFDGWRSYCVFSNGSATANSGEAVTHVSEWPTEEEYEEEEYTEEEYAGENAAGETLTADTV